MPNCRVIGLNHVSALRFHPERVTHHPQKMRHKRHDGFYFLIECFIDLIHMVIFAQYFYRVNPSFG